jgi:hypothetical protein
VTVPDLGLPVSLTMIAPFEVQSGFREVRNPILRFLPFGTTLSIVEMANKPWTLLSFALEVS